ncbi:YceK/YidQ family lipoprotein [uncultured Abyssibacter sp.]|uniref:YceK/YidQ family lipoprotein n=1 Tax=uncultured Abyssibacter sp. TaxID=2320202 RepID=UPI0032B172A9
MQKLVILLAMIAGAGVSSGCATVRTSDNAHVGSPKIYGGTRLNVAALSSDDAALARFEHYGIEPPSHPALDLPLSFVGDTLMLPFSAWYTLTEPVVGRE